MGVNGNAYKILVRKLMIPTVLSFIFILGVATDIGAL
jgi:hypothetical protein